MRVFELSKKVGISSKALIAILSKMDIQVKNHMSALTEDDVQAVLKKGDIPSSKPGKKKGISSKEKVEAPPPKKRFVLRKKRVAPPLTPEPPVVVKDDGAIADLKIDEPIEEIVASKGQTETPVLTPAEPVTPVKSVTPIKMEDLIEATIGTAVTADKGEADKIAETPVPTAPLDDAQTLIEKKEGSAPPSQATEETKKKLGKPETETATKPEVKKESPSKTKERPKRTRRVKWTPTEGDMTTEPSAEARQWQDFKPIHRRDDRKGARRGHGPIVDVAKPRKKVIKIYEGLTVKEFSELIGQKVSSIVGKLMELGKMATINQPIDLDEALLIAEAFEINAEVVSGKTEEEILMQAGPDDPSGLIARPPVITIMGHVDHGKTSLLDAIRETKVTEGEAGGITQHIGAYMVTLGEKQLTFLDTPGHEAFTAMRARGAKLTDIIILVVAADDGVMPQTVEAVNHAKVAGVPIIVAINKIDRPEANPDRVKQALSEYELIPEDWGGETLFAEVSAKEKTGLAQLLEMILLQAEILELMANPKKPMLGTIVEAKIEKGRGPVATVLVQEGTLRIGDAFVTGIHFGKVRALINDEGKKVKEAGPSTPVEVIGLDGVPLAGDTFIAVADERAAKEVANKRAQRQRTAKLSQVRRVTLDDLYLGIKEGTAKELNVIIKADVQGSAEALRESLEKLGNNSVKLKVIHGGVGAITESDVMLAAASNAFVIAFNVRPEPKAKMLASQEKISLRSYSVIYDVISDVRSSMEGLLDPTFEERILGKVEVRQTFSVPKQGVIAGGYVKEGVALRNCAGVRVIRDDNVVYEGKLASLRRFKDDVKEVQTGYECGIGIEGFSDIEVSDIFELYTFDEITTKLESA